MTLDETEEKQDVATSAETTETSETEPETFTREQVVERERKVRSDALSELGRLKKANESFAKANTKIQERMDRMIREQEDEELARAEGEPEKLSAIKERQAKRRVESKLADTERERDEEKEKRQQAEDIIGESTKEQNAREIAARLGVDAKRLIKLSKHTDGSKEVMEEIAQELPKKGEKTTLKPDSSKTSGVSGGIPTKMEQFRTWVAGLSQSEFEERSAEINKMMKEGKIK